MTTLNPPKNCKSMRELRAQIDALDSSIVDLLVLRASYIDRAIELKPSEGLPARIPAEQRIGGRAWFDDLKLTRIP